MLFVSATGILIVSSVNKFCEMFKTGLGMFGFVVSEFDKIVVVAARTLELAQIIRVGWNIQYLY